MNPTRPSATFSLLAASLFLGGAALGAACSAGESPKSNGGDGAECPGATLCDDKCVSTDSDPQHCGGCGQACAPGQVCAQGKCSLECVGGTTKCADACVSIQSDPKHCGGCGQACPEGQGCFAGKCALGCEQAGGTDCDGQCVDTQTNPKHCGLCGTECAEDQNCLGGECASICGPGLIKCSEDCADPKKSEKHCGGCDNKCKPSEDCVEGKCIECDSNDESLKSDSADPIDYAKALGICRKTTEKPELKAKTWGLIEAELLRADGSALGDHRSHSIRPGFGKVSPAALEGKQVVVISSGIAADATQKSPGPNGGAPDGSNVSTSHEPMSEVDIQSCGGTKCISDWFKTANPPLKSANALPEAPGCAGGGGDAQMANDSVMLRLRLRVPTNAKAFSFNSYFLSAEYPEYVCTDFNDQFVALVDTPGGQPQPIANPVDKNLMTYNDGKQKWPIGINIAAGTTLFSVCDSKVDSPECWDDDVSAASCSLGAGQLQGTGFEAGDGWDNCTIGGGTFWLTTSGNIIPGDIVELRIVIWDVGDTVFDSLALIDGFKWLPDATVPGTG
ncbi:MAG: choice-of-anchor L domain-containing protein [Deltaproteobacteria bacterium]|nr:choice-of-anchor L domain-containing protein [Deltaproteobacteria bacterium]